MLSEEYKEAVIKKLNSMTTEEFVNAMERAGSVRIDPYNKKRKDYRGDYHFNQYDGEPWFYK